MVFPNCDLIIPAIQKMLDLGNKAACNIGSIDPQTGVVKIERYSIVEDIGNVLNLKLAHGQIQGGVAMGIGQALGEKIIYDAQGGGRDEGRGKG